MKGKMRRILVTLPESVVQGLDKLVEYKLYPNRVEAIRLATTDLVKKEVFSHEVFERSIKEGEKKK